MHLEQRSNTASREAGSVVVEMMGPAFNTDFLTHKKVKQQSSNQTVNHSDLRPLTAQGTLTCWHFDPGQQNHLFHSEVSANHFVKSQS